MIKKKQKWFYLRDVIVQNLNAQKNIVNVFNMVYNVLITVNAKIVKIVKSILNFQKKSWLLNKMI